MACLHLGLLGLQQPSCWVLCLLLAAGRATAACQPGWETSWRSHIHSQEYDAAKFSISQLPQRRSRVMIGFGFESGPGASPAHSFLSVEHMWSMKSLATAPSGAVADATGQDRRLSVAD